MAMLQRTFRGTCRASFRLCAIGMLLALAEPALAQHLWWDADGHRKATCVYGQITVLATHSNTYYCGINWHPGEPAGGYCGIQHNGGEEKRTIFSVWDTSPTLHPSVIAADPKTLYGRFGGEGQGGHTHMLWPWLVGETFEFYVTKSPGENNSTDVRYYVFDRASDQWIHSTTVSCPDGGNAGVANISGGGMCSFLENFSGKDRDVPRLALYRLWIGTSPDNLKPLTHVIGDGKWGTLDDCYFLAAGSIDNLNALFATLKEKYGSAAIAAHDVKPAAISAKPMDAAVVAALKKLPAAPAVSTSSK